MCQFCKKSEDDTRCICELEPPTPMSFLKDINQNEHSGARFLLDRLEDKSDHTPSRSDGYRNLNKELYLVFNANFKERK